jgi:hypothetical protein
VRAALATLVLLACAVAPAAAQAARVDVLVVGKAGVLRPAKPVTLKAATVKVRGHRCRVAAATPLAALARVKPSPALKLRDYGACSKKPRDATGLYVRGIGRQVERGRSGWVYKIGRRTPSTGAGDPASKLRAGARLLWFWCVNGAKGCQRTLEVRPASATAAAGAPLTVTVTAYDDNGRGVPAAGATVTLGSASAVSGADGVATLTVPAGSSTLSAAASAPGLVPSFPVKVSIA